MIEVHGLTKRYGKHTAVDGISFSIEKGVIYGFLGPNGAGKSTTMNILTGYLAATEREAILDSLPTATKDFMKQEEFPAIDSSTLKSLTIVCDGKTVLECSSEDEEDDPLAACATALSQIELDDCADYCAHEEELADFGFGESEQRECTAVYTEDEEEKTVEFFLSARSGSGEKASAYVRLTDSDMVYRIDDSGLDALYD